MKKIKVQWTPSPIQDLDAMTNPKSPFYDKEFTDKIISTHGSIDKFKESDKWEEIVSQYVK